MMTVAPPVTDRATPAPAGPAGPAWRVQRGRAMRALVWAELREHGARVLAVAIAAAVVCCVVGYADAFINSGRADDDLINMLFWPGVQWITLLGCPLAGLGLGILQGLGERTFERWAFMKHRPLGRGWQFAARVMAGLVMYGVVVGLPLAGLIGYAMTRWGGGFFDWRFALPSAADGATGLVYYFAGLLVAERKAALWGSGLWPLVTAVGCSLWAVYVPEFWVAVGVVVIWAGVMAVSALGAHVSHGYTMRSPVWMRVATGAVLAGCLGMGAMVGRAGLEAGAYGAAEGAIERLPLDRTARTYTSYRLLPDGRVAKAVLHKAAGQLTLDRTATVYTLLDGTLLDTKQTNRAIEDTPMGSATLSLSNPPRLAMHYPPPRYRAINDSVEMIPVIRDEGGSYRLAERWYFYRTVGLYFGYDVGTGRFLGTIGEDGYVAGSWARPFDDRSPINWPQGEGRNTARGEVYVDVAARTVRLAEVSSPWAVPAGVTILRTEWLFVPDASRPREEPTDKVARRDLWYHPREMWNLALTPSSLYLYRLSVDRDDKGPPATASAVRQFSPTLVLPVLRMLADAYLEVTYFPDQHRWVLWYRRRPAWGGPAMGSTVEIFDESGKRLEHDELPAQVVEPPVPEWPGPGGEPIADSYSLASGAIDVGMGIPLRWGMERAAQWVDLPVASGHEAEGELLDRKGWYGAGMAVVLMGAVVGMWWLARRYGVRWKVAWALAGLAFGPVVGLLLIGMHRLPRRVACPGCRKGRFPEAEVCPQCGAGLAAPEVGATGIFA